MCVCSSGTWKKKRKHCIGATSDRKIDPHCVRVSATCVCAEHKRNSGEYELWRTKPFTYMRVYAVPDQAQAHVLNT